MPELTDFGRQLSDLGVTVRQVILDAGHSRDSCIETSRLGQMVFEHVGIPSRVMPVRVVAMNGLAYSLRQFGTPMEQWPREAWSIGIGWGSPRGAGKGWDGHLVNIVRDGPRARRMLDLSADQMDRPGLLKVPGPVGMIIREPWTPMDPQTRVLEDGNTMIEYHPFDHGAVQATKFKDTPAWTGRPDEFEEYKQEVLRRLNLK